MGDASGTARPLPLWRLRSGPRSSPINVRISPPEQSARLQRLTLQEVPFTPLLAWPRGLSPSADVEVSYEIADDLYLLDVVVRDFHAGELVLDRQHQLDPIE
jgi:hypothetical protein